MKYKAFILFLLYVGLLPGTAQAQWQRYFTAFSRQAARAGAANQTARTASLASGADRAVQQAAAQTVHFQSPLASSVLRVRESKGLPRFLSIKGTAFVLEENYQGKKYLWGVTASHYAYQHPAVQLPGTHKFFRVPFVIQSSPGRGDVSLFPIPFELADKVTALKLADLPPQLGDELHSVGFFNKKLQLDEHRIVQKISSDQLITSLKVDSEVSREGACGGPVLNSQQEVVGLHVGSSSRQQIGYAVPLEHIRYALQAYHESTVNLQPLVYDGVTLGTIGINEYIKSVVLYYEEQKERFSLFHQFIDYNHLEFLAQERQPDQIAFIIEQNPISTELPDQRYYVYTVLYDLKTGQITRTPSKLQEW